MLRPLQYIALRRHEVREKGPDLSRTTRQTIALKNVHYRLEAELNSRTGQDLKRHEKQFLRRLRLGQCRNQPYFGCREFPAYFAEPDPQLQPIDLDLDLGLMLYDVFNLSQKSAAPDVSLFHAVVRRGVLKVPEYNDTKVLKCSTV